MVYASSDRGQLYSGGVQTFSGKGPQPMLWANPSVSYNTEYLTRLNTVLFIQGAPLATEPGISLIILTPMKILQRNLNRSTFVVWEMWQHHNMCWKWPPFASRQDWTGAPYFGKSLPVRPLSLTVLFIHGAPLATEPGISLIILTPMKILQRNLNRSTFVVWEMWQHHNMCWKWPPFASRQDWTGAPYFGKSLPVRPLSLPEFLRWCLIQCVYGSWFVLVKSPFQISP